jgi:hypothetical protein
MRIYETTTRAIIEEMERGAVPWVRPWKTDRSNTGSVMPGNAITGRSYSGINVPILWASADSNGYPSHAWMTFKQAQDHGAHVRKGQRGTHVVFTKPLVFKGEDEEIEKRSMLREYTVFTSWLSKLARRLWPSVEPGQGRRASESDRTALGEEGTRSGPSRAGHAANPVETGGWPRTASFRCRGSGSRRPRAAFASEPNRLISFSRYRCSLGSLKIASGIGAFRTLFGRSL